VIVVVAVYKQGDHLSKKPGNVREFSICRESVKENFIREKLVHQCLVDCC